MTPSLQTRPSVLRLQAAAVQWKAPDSLASSAPDLRCSLVRLGAVSPAVYARCQEKALSLSSKQMVHCETRFNRGIVIYCSHSQWNDGKVPPGGLCFCLFLAYYLLQPFSFAFASCPQATLCALACPVQQHHFANSSAITGRTSGTHTTTHLTVATQLMSESFYGTN